MLEHFNRAPYLTAHLIEVNGKPVLKGTMPWRSELIQMRINNALQNEVMKSFSISPNSKGGRVQSDVINELISRLLMQDIHPDGFDEITLSCFSD